MLDNYSQGSFIKEGIIEELEITGRLLKLSLKTLTGEKSEELAAVNGLIIAAISCGKEGRSKWIEVPKAYSRSFLPVENKEITTPKKNKKWNYLHPITAEIKQDDNIEAGLLIGASCMKAIGSVTIRMEKQWGVRE